MSQRITFPAPTKAPTAARIVGRWMVSFLGFPLGGFAALALTDPVDSIGNALIGGLLSGAVLGAVQAWALRSDRRQLIAWTITTALGLAAGLALGACLVDYNTSIGDLALQGAVTGALVGLAQAVVLRHRTRPLAAVWPLYLAGAYALGWVVTTAGGIAVEQQFTIFGAYGAVTVAALTSVLPLVLSICPTSTDGSSS
jgi:hypothetical protein